MDRVEVIKPQVCDLRLFLWAAHSQLDDVIADYAQARAKGRHVHLAPDIGLLHLAQAHVLRNPPGHALFRTEPVAHGALVAAQGARQVSQGDAKGIVGKLGRIAVSKVWKSHLLFLIMEDRIP